MRLSDDIGPTFSGPGSPGPRRRWGRKKTLATALALTAAAGVAGLTQATSASAATVGTVAVYVSVADAYNWGAGWNSAWNQCRNDHPDTRSVERAGSEYLYYRGVSKPWGAKQTWKCRNTP